MALIACGETDLFTKPPKSAGTALPLPTLDSTIGARVAIKLAAIQVALEKAVPLTYSGTGKPDNRPCAKVGLGSIKTKNCVNVEAPFTVTRGVFTVVQRDANAVRFVVPIAISGNGKIKGSGAIDKLVIKAWSLSAKSFKGAGTLTADVAVSLSEDWCPIPKVVLNMSWSQNPKLEIAHKVWMDVAGVVKPAVNQNLNQIEASLAKSIPCDSVRAEAQKALATRSVLVDLPDEIGKMFVNVRTTAAGFSGVAVSPEAVSFAIQVSAKTDIAPEALTAGPTALPPLKTIAAEAPRIRLAVPVRVRYDLLSKAANAQLSGKSFEIETPAGKAKVKVSAVEVYPSGSRVAVGVSAALDVPGRWADVKGNIFVLGVPQVTGTLVSLKNVAFAQVLDNKAWDLVSLALRARIIKEIENAARYDLATESGRVQAALEGAIAKAATDGLLIKPVNAQIGLGAVAVAADTLEVEGRFEATLDATVNQLAGR